MLSHASISTTQAEGPDPEQLAARVEAILESTAHGTLATVTPDGQAWANTIRYTYDDGLRLYFVSSPTTQHAENIAVHPSVALSVFDSSQRGPKRGLQLFGTCSLAEGDAFEQGYALMRARFDWFRLLAPVSSDLQKDDAHVRLYVVSTEHAKVLDEDAFGWSPVAFATTGALAFR